MVKQKRTFGGPSWNRRQMAGPYRQPQRPAAPQPPPPAPSAAPGPSAPAAAAGAQAGPAYQVRVIDAHLPGVAAPSAALRHMAAAAYLAGIPDWQPLTDAEKAARDRQPIVLIEDPSVRNPLAAHVTFDNYPQPTYAIVAPAGSRNQVAIIPRYKTKLAFFGVLEDGKPPPQLTIGCRRIQFIVHHIVMKGFQLACLCAALPFERHHLIIRTVAQEPTENRTVLIPVSTPFPWLAYYIVANRDVKLFDFAAARMAISTRYIYSCWTSLLDQYRMDYSLSAHLEALLFFNKDGTDPNRCTFVFSVLGGHLARRTLDVFIKRENVSADFERIQRFITTLPEMMSDLFAANLSFIDENLESPHWTSIGKGYAFGDMIPALQFTPLYREINHISPLVTGETPRRTASAAGLELGVQEAGPLGSAGQAATGAASEPASASPPGTSSASAGGLPH